jgi:hypothetical protein
MLFSAMLINALHAALEDAVVVLDRVGGDVAANVFILAMGDCVVAAPGPMACSGGLRPS